MCLDSLSIQMDSDWPDNVMSFEKNNEMKDSVILRTFAGGRSRSALYIIVYTKLRVIGQ